MPPAEGGGEFRGLNNLGGTMLALGLFLAGGVLSVVGCALGIVGFIKQESNLNLSFWGLSLNLLAVVAVTVVLMSQNSGRHYCHRVWPRS